MAEYIERTAAIVRIRIEGVLSGSYYSEDEVENNVVGMLESIPAADVAPVVHGRWSDREEPDEDGNIIEWCSRCGHSDTHSPRVEVPYCWFCGAKMDGGVKNEAD